MKPQLGKHVSGNCRLTVLSALLGLARWPARVAATMLAA